MLLEDTLATNLGCLFLCKIMNFFSLTEHCFSADDNSTG